MCGPAVVIGLSTDPTLFLFQKAPPVSIPLCQINAFTDAPFGGNPAAVCLLPGTVPDRWMQNVAAEMNLSETAFLHPIQAGYSLRWFTPTTEVDLCGHATLAATQALCEWGRLVDRQRVHFSTRSGVLTALRADNLIELDFPLARADRLDHPPAEMLEALDVRPLFVGMNRLDYVVEVATVEEVQALTPDFERLKRLGLRGVMVTARSRDSECDFVSRFFAPGAGIDEDPVTGSAHCCLGPYWASKLGKSDLVAHQISARKGELRLRVTDDRIYISGKAVTVLKGALCI
jgi:predicted PhzF superfamily epimerase YddE/YHI9